MRKKVIIFGAGQIGRGFIGEICYSSGYFLVFVDVFKNVIDLLNKEKKYPLWILGKEKEEKFIENFKGIYFDDKESVSNEIKEANLIFTAVGVNNLKSLAPLISEGILKKFSANKSDYLNIIICENLLGSGKILYSEVLEYLPPEFKEVVFQKVGFVESVVSRMVAPITDEIKKINPLIVRVEPYNKLPVDKKAFKGEIPDIKGLYPVENLYPYEELKIFVHNLSHACLAYLGYLSGYTYIWQCMEDKKILKIFKGVLNEVKEALIKKHKFDEKEIDDYIYDLQTRFKNKLLGDTVFRVGRDPLRKLGPDDRIIGSINLCLSQNIFPANICVVASACLCYNYQNDKQAVELEEIIRNNSVEFVLKEICKLENKEIIDEILKHYEEIKNESSTSKRNREFRNY
ncbi:MAG TPA: mannitol-1-phosphate 5-dehydrogenase [bacterium]|nr:mannitol-1-phosphate 5-dehydrogenase [bacterium]